MPDISAAKAAEVCRGELRGDGSASARAFVADSRRVMPGVAYVAAMRTGHSFVPDALAAGAPYVVVRNASAVPPAATGVVVEDVESALASLAAWFRTRLRARVVAVTGSTGKTGTKDMIAAALRPRFRVHAAPSSYNNEVGLPLTVLGCPGDAEVLVTELGARHAGDIAALCEIARPHAGVITGIGHTHLEVFGSRRAIADAKSELLRTLPADGVAVVPSADDFLHVLDESCEAELVTVGAGGAVRILDVTLDAGGRASGSVMLRGGHREPIRVPVLGRALMRNAALALATAVELGAGASEAAAAISSAPMTGLRMQVSEHAGRTLVNDAWNSNPTSALSAFKTLSHIAAGRPMWAFLAPMAELGDSAADGHRRVGAAAAALSFERVVTVGDAPWGLAPEIVVRAAGIEDALEAASDVPPDAVVLVKGSRKFALERLAAALADAWSGAGTQPQRTSDRI
jgi:UDP-N-acetylmuramoyl-tripeptide--D-alanyl-D-alanine ligase